MCCGSAQSRRNTHRCQFIVAYTKLNRRSPAEADFRPYFSVTPPSVHSMILTLERRGLVKRVADRLVRIEVLVPPNEIPALD
jgi:Mn-dependent DtxR family transcriptional regulator